MAQLAWRCPTASGDVHVVVTDRRDGDFHLDHVPPAELAGRRRAVVDLPWTMLHEVHGTVVRRVSTPGEHDRAVGDVAVTAVPDAVLGTWTGDCAPVVVVAPDGRFGVAHAGWRGLAAGVLGTLGAALGVGPGDGAVAFLGPVVGACCYEFGERELLAVAAGAGVDADAVRAQTTWGTASLDVTETVRSGLAALGVTVMSRHTGTSSQAGGGCTACAGRWFSHRLGDRQRHVTAAWRPRATSPGRTVR